MYYSEEDNIKFNNSNFEYIFTYDNNDILLEKKMLSKKQKGRYRKFFRMKCKYCDKEFDMRSDSKMKKCKNCCGCYENSFAHHIEVELGLNINDVWDFELNTLNPYHISKANHYKIWIKCDKHGSYPSDPGHFKGDKKRKGTRCPKCGDIATGEKRKHSYEYVKEYIENTGYKLLSKKYEGANEHIEIQCPFSHKPYLVTFHNFKNHDRRCPYCHISKGESKIMMWLKENDIKYVYEQTYPDLLGLGNGLLSYDFYLPKYNLLIEYQGIQHEKEQKGFGDFERQQEHDRRKREYAEEHNIKLLEIWYYDFDNINEILDNIFKQQNK